MTPKPADGAENQGILNSRGTGHSPGLERGLIVKNHSPEDQDLDYPFKGRLTKAL
jgi:hypothetical protein